MYLSFPLFLCPSPHYIIMAVMVYTLYHLPSLRSSYNPLGAGSSRRPPSGAMGIPPAGARAPYRAPTGEILTMFSFV